MNLTMETLNKYLLTVIGVLTLWVLNTISGDVKDLKIEQAKANTTVAVMAIDVKNNAATISETASRVKMLSDQAIKDGVRIDRLERPR